MLNKTLTLNDINHIYGIGQEVWFSCLIPKFNWFDKILSIDNIIEPTKTKIVNNKLIPTNLSSNDIIILKQTNNHDKNIVRKFILQLHLELGETIKIEVFEKNNKEIILIIPHTYLISFDYNSNRNDFYYLVIHTKADIEFDTETRFKNDKKYKLFKQSYEKAEHEFPEEVIRSHDRFKNNV